MVSNSNGANQFRSDPRQKNCWDYYINPNSPTFANGLKSAIAAGYSAEYAKTITVQTWFKDKKDRLELLDKAEKKLRETLEYDPVITADGVVKGVDSSLLRVQADVSKFLASTLGKDKGYSTRSELTGKDGEKIFVVTHGNSEDDKD